MLLVTRNVHTKLWLEVQSCEKLKMIGEVTSLRKSKFLGVGSPVTFFLHALHSPDLKIPSDSKEFMWDPLFFQKVTPVERNPRTSFLNNFFLTFLLFFFKSGTFGNKRRAFSNSIVKKTQLKTWLRDGQFGWWVTFMKWTWEKAPVMQGKGKIACILNRRSMSQARRKRHFARSVRQTREEEKMKRL